MVYECGLDCSITLMTLSNLKPQIVLLEEIHTENKCSTIRIRLRCSLHCLFALKWEGKKTFELYCILIRVVFAFCYPPVVFKDIFTFIHLSAVLVPVQMRQNLIQIWCCLTEPTAIQMERLTFHQLERGTVYNYCYALAIINTVLWTLFQNIYT